jgi:hypothetical protein
MQPDAEQCDCGKSRLKIRRGQPHGGSIPPPGTKLHKMNKLPRSKPLNPRGFFMLEKLWCRFVPDLLIWIQGVPEHAQDEYEKGMRRL